MAPTTPKENRPPSPKRLSLKLWIGVPLGLILALMIILSQIDLESVKENLVQRISKETNLKVEIESIGFSFSHGLGFQLKGVKVRSPEGNSYSVDRLHLLAEWAPLLKGEFKIKCHFFELKNLEIEDISSSQLESGKMERREIAHSKGLGDRNNKKDVTFFEKSNVSCKFQKTTFLTPFCKRKN